MLCGPMWWIHAVLLFESALLVGGAMQGELIMNIQFYRRFENLPSLRCSTAYGIGTQSDRLIGNNQKHIQTLKNSLTTASQKQLIENLKTSDDHDISIFTIDELRSVIIYMTGVLNEYGLEVYLSLRSKWDSLAYETIYNAVLTWPPIVHLVMKEDLMCNLMSRLDEELLATLCKRLAELSVTVDTVLEYLDRCAYCAGIAVQRKESTDLIRIVQGYKAIALKEKLKQIYPSDWDIYMIMMVPDALEKEDIVNIASSHFCDDIQMTRIVNETFYPYLTRDVKVAIAERIRECRDKQLSEWTVDELIHYAPYIIHLKTETLQDELSGAMDKAVSVFKHYMDFPGSQTTDFYKAVAPFVNTYWAQASEGLSDVIKTLLLCVVFKYAPDESFLNSVDPTDLKIGFENTDVCRDLHITQKDLASVVERYATSDGFVWDDATIELLGPFMGEVKLSVIWNIGDKLCSNWEHSLTDTPFPQSVLMAIWNKCSGSIGLDQKTSWTCEDIKAIGSFLSMLNITEISSIPKESLFDCADYLENVAERTGVCDSNPGVCAKVVQLIKEHVTESSMAITDLVSKIGPALLNAMDFAASDFTFDDIEGLSAIDMDVELAGVLWDAVEGAKGDVSSDNAGYTSQTFSHITGVFAIGASINDLLNLPEDDGLLTVLSHMSQYISSLNGKKMEIILDKLYTVFGLKGNSEDVCVEEALLREVGMYFARASVSEFVKLSTKSLKAVLSTLGQKYEYVKYITPPRMRTLMMMMLKTEGIENANSFSQSNVGKYGPYMWCGMTQTHAQKLSSSALTTYLTQIVRCIHFDSGTRAAIVVAVKNHLESTGFNLQRRPDIFVTVGHFLPDYAGMSDATLSTVVNVIVDIPWTLNYITFKISLYLGEVSAIDENVIGEDERQQYNDKKSQLLYAVFSYNGASNGRRRRSSTALTCDDIRSYQGHLEFLTQAIAQNIPEADVVDCLSEFQNASLSSDVVTVLLDKLKSTDGFGDLSTWTSGEIVRAGALLDGLTQSEIQSLTFTEQIVSAINHIQFDKSADIISAYLDDSSVSDMSMLTEETLALMGTLLCGYTISHISAMDSTAAFNAANDVCHIKCLTTEQLQAFGDNIADHVGTDWSTVEPYIIESMGVCMGGLPATVLGTFTVEEVGNLQPTAIKNMPPAVFTEVFDAEMMSHLSGDQANVVTTDQIAQMDPKQLAVFNTKTTLNEEDTSIFVTTTTTTTRGGSGAAKTGFPNIVAVLLLAIALLVLP